MSTPPRSTPPRSTSARSTSARRTKDKATENPPEPPEGIYLSFGGHEERSLPAAGKGIGLLEGGDIRLLHIGTDGLWATDKSGQLLFLDVEGMKGDGLYEAFEAATPQVNLSYVDSNMRRIYRSKQMAEWLRQEKLFEEPGLWSESSQEDYFRSAQFAHRIRMERRRSYPTGAHLIKETLYKCRRRYETSNVSLHSCVAIPGWHKMAIDWASFYREGPGGDLKARPTRSVTHYLTFDWGSGKSLSSWGVFADGTVSLFAD